MFIHLNAWHYKKISVIIFISLHIASIALANLLFAGLTPWDWRSPWHDLELASSALLAHVGFEAFPLLPHFRVILLLFLCFEQLGVWIKALEVGDIVNALRVGGIVNAFGVGGVSDFWLRLDVFGLCLHTIVRHIFFLAGFLEVAGLGVFPSWVGKSDLFACRVHFNFLCCLKIDFDPLPEQVHQHLFEAGPLHRVILG